MNKCSGDCVYDYYESDTNYGECRHPDFDSEKPDHCPGYLSKEDANAQITQIKESMEVKNE